MGPVLVRTQPRYHSEMSEYGGSHTVTRTILSLILMAGSLVLSQDGSGNGLPAGAEEILSSSYNPDSFSCDNQAYGYYADVESGCEVTCVIFSPMIFILSRSSTSASRLRVRRRA